jgi:hypothetical protein
MAEESVRWQKLQQMQSLPGFEVLAGMGKHEQLALYDDLVLGSGGAGVAARRSRQAPGNFHQTSLIRNPPHAQPSATPHWQVPQMASSGERRGAVGEGRGDDVDTESLSLTQQDWRFAQREQALEVTRSKLSIYP